MSNQYKSGFNFLKLFLEKKYDVSVIQISGAEDAWYPAIKKIIVNKDLQWRERLLALMHESGHVQIDLESYSIKFILHELESRPYRLWLHTEAHTHW